MNTPDVFHTFLYNNNSSEKFFNISIQPEKDIVITDGKKPVCIAGVMGGENTDVDENTKDILIESAIFDSVSIRNTAGRLNLRSEASIRYGKGLNYEYTEAAINRACYLLKKYANGKERASRAEFWWWQLFVFVVSFCTGFLDGLLGFEIGISGILSLGLLLPNICVAIRRCHDSNHSGWWIICPVVNIVMMFLPSDPNANEYGEPEISSAEKEVY